MNKIKSLSGKHRQGHSYEGLSDPSVPNTLLLTDALKAQAFCAHFSEAPSDIAEDEKNPPGGEEISTWG